MTETAQENMLTREQMKQLLAIASQNSPVDSSDVDAVDYDWNRPHHFSTRHHRRLKEFTDELNIELAEQFASIYPDETTVTIPGLEEHFATKLQTIQNNTRGSHYLTFNDTSGHPVGMVIVPKRSAVHWAAKMLRDTIPDNTEEAQLSQLELSLLTDFSKAIVNVLSECFGRHNLPQLKTSPELIFEEWPLDLTDFEELSVLEFAVSSGEEQTSASFVLLSRVFDGMFDINSEHHNLSEKEIRDAIVSHLNNIPLKVGCELGTAKAMMSDLMTLEPGDVLVLDQTITTPIKIKIDDKVFFQGRLAKSMNRYSISITEIVKKPASIIKTG